MLYSRPHNNRKIDEPVTSLNETGSAELLANGKWKIV
jgi:hypothetical protein